MRLLILGTGGMAAAHAEAFAEIESVELAGCVDVNVEAAEAFAQKHGFEHVHGSLDEALASGKYTAMANVTPDAVHHKTTLQALASGLHVFCEKPLATNQADAREMADAAKSAGLVSGVNLTYRNVAALQLAAKLVRDGAIGALRHFEASYLQSWLTQPSWGDWKTEDKWLWRLSEAHGSLGVLGDIGIHIIDFASFAAGSEVCAATSMLTTFDKAPGGQIGRYKLDANDSFAMTAQLENGATGVIHASRFASGHNNDLNLALFGTKGGLRVNNTGPLGEISICVGEDDLLTKTWRTLTPDPVETTYQKFASAVQGKTRMDPDFGVAARLQEVLDLTYELGQRPQMVKLSSVR